MERFMPRNTLKDIRCDRWGLSQRERKKNPRASESTLTWGQHTNRHNTDFPSLQKQTQSDHGVVEEVTACSVGVGAACKAWGFPYFLLHVIIYFLKLNHALLMVPNAIGNAASSIITSLKRAKEKNTLLTAVQATDLMNYFKSWFSCIEENGYLITFSCIM